MRVALGAEFREKQVPYPVVLPISDVLGTGGHRWCSGWQLEPVDGSMQTARKYRDEWVAKARDGILDEPPPATRPAQNFDGGTMTFMFGPNRGRTAYEIVTMYVNPPGGHQ